MGRRRAILIGCDAFSDDAYLPPLDYPQADIELLGGVLEEPDICDFDIERLPNPTYADAQLAINKMTSNAERGDLIMVYYSGHGKLDTDGSLMLALPETREDALGASALSVQQIKRWLNISAARRKILILDCCYSGAASDNRLKGDVESELSRDSEGTFLLTASTKSQAARENREIGAGVLTHCLVTGIRTGEAGRPDTDQITMPDLAEYAKREVPKLSAGQRPKSWDVGSTGEIHIAKRQLILDEAKRDQLTRHFAGWFGDHEIRQALYDEISAALRDQAFPADQATVKLLIGCLDGTVRPGVFVEEWTSLHRGVEQPPEPAPPPQKPAPPPEVPQVEAIAEQPIPEPQETEAQPQKLQSKTATASGFGPTVLVAANWLAAILAIVFATWVTDSGAGEDEIIATIWFCAIALAILAFATVRRLCEMVTRLRVAWSTVLALPSSGWVFFAVGITLAEVAQFEDDFSVGVGVFAAGLYIIAVTADLLQRSRAHQKSAKH